ncbi:hypothetical protein CY35_03G015300 [Sphagnum magellanicum]|nr:hypothetical protein CY35_03G015300 [Sphagnum magellanicum]KAH9567136.1 hypothetical protein CY35_03G015300 [Sphagnum magellanicum]
MVNSVSVVSITVRVSANAYCGKAHLLLLLLLLHQLLISLSSLSTSEIRGCCELASARWLRRRIHSVSPSLGTCMMTGMQFKMPRHSNFWSYETNHPDLVLFTGDFGEENVELVQDITNLEFPKAVILGNHDAWWSTYNLQLAPSEGERDGVQTQLDLLGKAHVGSS